MTKNLAGTIGVNGELVDPLTQANYIYSVDKNFKKYQVLGYLENSRNTAMLKNNNFLVNTTYAEEIKYTDKYLITYGNEVGIILNKDNSPVIASSVNIDCNTKNDYKLVLSETKSFDSISWQNMYSGALCYDAEYERDPAFTTTWKVGTTGFGNADNTIKFTLSYVGAGEIEWGDGEKTAISTSSSIVTHTYASAGDYTVKIRGDIRSFYNYDWWNSNYFGKLVKVKSWGDMKWNSMYKMFHYANNFNTAFPTKAPNMTNVTNMEWMFYNATNFNQSLSNFDTSKVTNMRGMFRSATNFNQSLSNFDTSKVTNMRGMFYIATNFNQSLASFDTSKVTDMSDMFHVATNFNQSLDTFNTSNVRSMYFMFSSATNFNQSLSNFNTSKVTDMGYMFNNMTAFNQSLSNFDTSKVTNMSYMFQNTQAFNQSLDSFDTSKVTNMGSMFLGTRNFNQSLDSFDTSKVTNMNSMFIMATAFDQNIHNWCVTNITSKPSDFDSASNAGFRNNEGKQPDWGTCH